MADVSLTLTSEEQAFLADHLEVLLSQTLLEEHRTESSSYRKHIHRHEQIVEALLAKLRTSKTTAGK
jgi:hypothetical protein